MFKHVPNILTIVRFLLIPIILILIFQENYIWAFVVLTLSGITDILDGYIARKFNFVTDFGKLMDPLADKLTQISILVSLCIKEIVPVWMIIIIFLKELLMIGGASFLYKKDLVFSSKWWGKLATVIFYIAIACSLIIHYFKLNVNFDIYIYYIALFATLFSLVMYFKASFKQEYLDKKK